MVWALWGIVIEFESNVDAIAFQNGDLAFGLCIRIGPLKMHSENVDIEVDGFLQVFDAYAHIKKGRFHKLKFKRNTFFKNYCE
jgi:hypothetical protein